MYIIGALILGMFILCGNIILGRYLWKKSPNSEIGKYQMLIVDEKNIIILDTRTGQYWKKPIVENSSVKTNSKETDKFA